MWEWFVELHNRRPFDGASGLSQRLTHLEIAAWSALSGIALATHELRLLTKLDDMFIDLERKKRSREMQESKMKAKGGR